jgi:hypothetical protein
MENVTLESLDDAIKTMAAGLVRHSRIDRSHFVNLPILYPDGSYVTVRIEDVKSGVRISDAGFAFRQADDIGASRSFKRTAKKIAEAADVEMTGNVLFVETSINELERAVLDVAETSRRAAAKIWQKYFDEDDGGLSDELKERLAKVFGPSAVEEDTNILGSSTTNWDVSAIVKFPSHTAVFQSVTVHSNSVNKASTVFHDIAALERPPRLIAVVRNKAEFGTKLALLAPARVIETDQADEIFMKAAA